MPATMPAPKTTTRAFALHILRNAEAAGPERAAAAVQSLARKAGIEAAERRLTKYGAAWLDADRSWRSRDAIAAVTDVEAQIGRELTWDENGAFVVAMIDLMGDLV